MTSHPSIVLGITGGIACGKSEAGRVLSTAGFDVLDTDLLAHQLMAAGTPVFDQIVAHFGKSILSADSEIDRAALGEIIFADPEARETLNELVHPAVMSAVEDWVAAHRAAQRDAAVLIPLLFETGWTQGWDAVVCVAANEEVVFHRLENRGLNKKQASERIASQMRLDKKIARSDFNIENNGSLKGLRSGVLRLLECIRNERN